MPWIVLSTLVMHLTSGQVSDLPMTFETVKFETREACELAKDGVVRSFLARVEPRPGVSRITSKDTYCVVAVIR